MQRLPILLLISAMLVASSGCASKKYVRNTVNASADALTTRIEGNESEMKEIRDSLDKKITGVDTRVTSVDGKVSALDAKTSEGLNTLRTDLKSDVSNVDKRTTEARTAADRAGTAVN